MISCSEYYASVWNFINETKADEINKAYDDLKNKSILTYIKIRCDDNIKYNERYNVYLNHPNSTTFYMTGPDSNFQARFYRKEGEVKGVFDGEKDRTIQDISKLTGITNIAENLIGDPVTKELCYINKYDYGYIYGPFTKVFRPTVSNKLIAMQCTQIIDNFTGEDGKGKTVIEDEFKN